MAEEVKAEALNLIVRDQSGHEVNFKVKATTKFDKARRSRAGRGAGRRGGRGEQNNYRASTRRFGAAARPRRGAVDAAPRGLHPPPAAGAAAAPRPLAGAPPRATAPPPACTPSARPHLLPPLPPSCSDQTLLALTISPSWGPLPPPPPPRDAQIFKAYCNKQSLDVGAVRFLFDGQRLIPDTTPAAEGMQDGDSIDCVISQLGGGGHA